MGSNPSKETLTNIQAQTLVLCQDGEDKVKQIALSSQEDQSTQDQPNPEPVVPGATGMKPKVEVLSEEFQESSDQQEEYPVGYSPRDQQ